jgi:hypothetical protein
MLQTRKARPRWPPPCASQEAEKSSSSFSIESAQSARLIGGRARSVVHHVPQVVVPVLYFKHNVELGDIKLGGSTVHAADKSPRR